MSRVLSFRSRASKYLVTERWISLPYWLGICRLPPKVVWVLRAVDCWRKGRRLQFPSLGIGETFISPRDGTESVHPMCLAKYPKVSFVSAENSRFLWIDTHPTLKSKRKFKIGWKVNRFYPPAPSPSNAKISTGAVWTSSGRMLCTLKSPTCRFFKLGSRSWKAKQSPQYPHSIFTPSAFNIYSTK